GAARRPLPRLHRKCAEPRRLVPVLDPGDLRAGDPARREGGRDHRPAHPASDRSAARSVSDVVHGPSVAGARSGRSWLGVLARWETLLVVAIAGLVVLGTLLSPFFLTPGNFSNLIAALMEVAIMALPMTLIIVAGEIDLSVESMACLDSSMYGFMLDAGVTLNAAIPLVLVVGALG